MHKLIPTMISLAIILAACTNPVPPQETPAFRTAIATFCGFTGVTQDVVTGPDGTKLPIEIREVWFLVPAEDDNADDSLEPYECQTSVAITVAGPGGPEHNLFISIRYEGATGTTAVRDGIDYDAFATNDLLTAEGLGWIYDLGLRSRTSLTRFWFDTTTGAISAREPLSDEALSDAVKAEAEKYHLKSGWSEYLPNPPQLAGLPGWNYVEIRQQCFLSGELEAGAYPISCQKYVVVFLDDPSTEDTMVGSISLGIYTDHLDATRYAGMFSIYVPGPDPQSVIEKYGLTDLMDGFCQMAETVTFRVNIYTGAVADTQVQQVDACVGN